MAVVDTELAPTRPTGSEAAPLRVRWLGQVAYGEAWDLQQALFDGTQDHLLLCQHRPVYTLGVRGDEANLLVDPATVGAELYRVNRGGDVTFHGPGQLVGYPVMSVPGRRGGGMADTVAYVRSVEQLLIDVTAELGLTTARLPGFPGVWVEPEGRARKLAAIGVRLSRGRSMHGFALNVNVDLGWFDHIVPCGITGRGVTSLAAEGIDVSMTDVVELVARHGARLLAPGRPVEAAGDVGWPHAPHPPTGPGLAPVASDRVPKASAGLSGAMDSASPASDSAPAASVGVSVQLRGRLAKAGVTDGLAISERKPDWMKVKVRTDPEFLRLKRLSRQLDLVTVCEEAGCPNIYECWNEGTATFMLLGERCTRACGFCAVDTAKPEPPDPGEPDRVAEAIAHLGLDYAVLTMVARDDLDDGGAEIVARTVEAIRQRSPRAGVEVLISDLKGSAPALERIGQARPDVINHNIETVARLQRAVRPSASYARSLTVLARAAGSGITTKSGLIVGMGESPDEVRAALADLAAVGVSIVTIGQYLRPTARHLPMHRWWTPDELDDLKRYGCDELGIAHIEASPLTRSSHHAGAAALAAEAHRAGRSVS